MPPTLSTPVAVVMILSLLLGAATQVIQTGALFGTIMPPKTWLPGFTMGATFLGGVVAYFGGLSPLVIDASTVFYAVAAGITALLAGSAPGLAVHAHVVVPAQARALRTKAVAAAAAVAACFVLLACNPAQDATFQKEVNIVLTDLTNGVALDVMESAIKALIPQGADVDVVINDIITFLHDDGELSPNVLPQAVAIQSQIAVKLQANQVKAKGDSK